MNYNIDYDKLRNDLINYFEGIAFNISRVAFIDVSKVENADNNTLIKIALDNNIDLNNYIKNDLIR